MAERFEIRPLGLWDRPVTNPRASASRFRASWDDTIRLLLDEVALLDGGLVVVQVDADPTEIRLDGMLRARARVGPQGGRRPGRGRRAHRGLRVRGRGRLTSARN